MERQPCFPVGFADLGEGLPELFGDGKERERGGEERQQRWRLVEARLPATNSSGEWIFGLWGWKPAGFHYFSAKRMIWSVFLPAATGGCFFGELILQKPNTRVEF